LILGLAALALVGRAENRQMRAEIAGWNEPQPGSLAVGFRLSTVYDQSRIFHSNPEFRGLEKAAETARLIRLYLWYPAQEAGGEHLRLRDYVRMAAEDFDLLSAGAAPAHKNLPLPVPLAKGMSEKKRLLLLSERTTAVENAQPLAERFPLIILGQGLYYESPLSLFTLAEYLAGQGYVVATSPLVGTYSRLVNRNVIDLETQVRDMEYVLAQARTLPFVDKERMGVVGYDLGGMAGLLMAMRNPWVKAMVSLDTGILYPTSFGLPAASPSYQENRFIIPWLMMTQDRFVSKNPAAEKQTSLFDRKTAGDSYLFLCRTENHGDFTSYAALGMENAVPGYWGPIKGKPRLLHDTIDRLSGRFFDAYLKNDARALEELRQNPSKAGPGEVIASARYKAGSAGSLFQDDCLQDIIRRGTEESLPRIRRLLEADKTKIQFEEGVLNWLGYHFLYWWGREQEARDVFQFITELFPRSGNAFDSLGEAFFVLGDRARALESYRRSLELNPDNANAREMIKRLEAKD
jgi:tetratricopeptide (TPR) repeat protein